MGLLNLLLMRVWTETGLMETFSSVQLLVTHDLTGKPPKNRIIPLTSGKTIIWLLCLSWLVGLYSIQL
jgi:hypothetical protein